MNFDEKKVISLLSVNPNGTQSFAHGQLKNAAIELVQMYGVDWAKPGGKRSLEVAKIRGQIRKILGAYGPKEHSNVYVNWKRLKDYAIAYEQEAGTSIDTSKPASCSSENQILLEPLALKSESVTDIDQSKFITKNTNEELTFRQIIGLFFIKLRSLFK